MLNTRSWLHTCSPATSIMAAIAERRANEVSLSALHTGDWAQQWRRVRTTSARHISTSDQMALSGLHCAQLQYYCAWLFMQACSRKPGTAHSANNTGCRRTMHCFQHVGDTCT